MGVLSQKFCPQCKGSNIVMVAGGEVGMWQCVDCGFMGSLFPEKEVVGREEGMKDTKKIVKKGGKK